MADLDISLDGLRTERPPSVVVATPAIIDAGDDLMRGLVVDRARAYLLARYTHGDGPANRNGHLFRTDDLTRMHVLVPGTPLNMMHRTRDVVGTFMRATMVHPDRQRTSHDRAPRPYNDTPWVKAIAAVWSYHFPDEARDIRRAYDAGSLWVSQESVPKTVTCPTCDHNAPWRGYTHDGYCDHMQGRKPKWMESPHFVGGGLILPPWQPGWKDAHVETFDALAAEHPEAAASIIAQLEEAAPHLTDQDRAAVAAQLLDRARPDDAEPVDVRHLVAPIWASMVGHYNDIDFRMPVDAVAVIDAAIRSSACLDAATPARLAWARSVLDGAPRTPAGVRRLADELAAADPGSADYLLRGGTPASSWAAATVAAMDAIDAAVAAMLADAGTSNDPDSRFAAARAGEAMPDGSFHITRPEDLTIAIRALNAARPAKREAVKAHLLNRARQLHASEELIAEIEQLDV